LFPSKASDERVRWKERSQKSLREAWTAWRTIWPSTRAAELLDVT